MFRLYRHFSDCRVICFVSQDISRRAETNPVNLVRPQAVLDRALQPVFVNAALKPEKPPQITHIDRFPDDAGIIEKILIGERHRVFSSGLVCMMQLRLSCGCALFAFPILSSDAAGGLAQHNIAGRKSPDATC